MSKYGSGKEGIGVVESNKRRHVEGLIKKIGLSIARRKLKGQLLWKANTLLNDKGWIVELKPVR